MTSEQFNEVLQCRVGQIYATLASKGKEYGREDRLHNFKDAANMNDQTPERALWGMLTKHIVSVKDIINDLETQAFLPKVELIEEKIGDSINYLILLEALLKERLKCLKK